MRIPCSIIPTSNMARDGTAGWVAILPPRWRASIDRPLALAIQAEFLGTLLFVFASSTVSSALAVGMAYAVASYATASISGGHLNPVLTLAQAFSGHAHFATAGLYIMAQLLGAVAGTLVEALIIPGYHIGHNKHAVPSGCFAIHDVSSWRLLVLEFVFTFFFLAVLYGTAVGTSGNGFTVLSPLAAGLAIYVSIEAIGPYTGAPLNPARLIGPAVVFFCNWRHFWVWLAGELLAAVAAAAFAAGTFGVGDAYSDNQATLDRHVGEQLGERLMPDRSSV